MTGTYLGNDRFALELTKLELKNLLAHLPHRSPRREAILHNIREALAAIYEDRVYKDHLGFPPEEEMRELAQLCG